MLLIVPLALREENAFFHGCTFDFPGKDACINYIFLQA
jgi:hypothetical protein